MVINFVVGSDLSKMGGIQKHVLCLSDELKRLNVKINWINRNDKNLSFTNKAIPGLKVLLKNFRSRENFHFFGFTCFYVAFLLNVISTKATVIYTPCMHPFETHSKPIFAKYFFLLFVKPMFYKVDKILVFSQSESDFYCQYVDCSKVKIVPSGVYLDRKYKANAKDRNYFVFVGRDDQNKRLSVLEAVAKRNPNLRFKFVTNNEKMSTGNIEYFRGLNDEEIIDLYANAIATVVPSKYESFSIVTLESLAAGTPVIISENVQIREFLSNDIKLVIDEADLVNNLEIALIKFHNARNDMDDVSNSARKNAQKFEWSNIAKLNFETYSELDCLC